jgi:transposase
MSEEVGAPRFKSINRQQLMLRTVDVEALIEEDHPARAIWAFTGRMDWRRFYSRIQAVQGVAGRAAWDPRLLGSLWIYAYSRGIGSAREIARRCAYDPAFQWLTGLQEVNYHTMADFRVDFKEPLDELFVQALGLLSAEGLIAMERVMHDGTKIKACAGGNSFRREERIRSHLKAARAQVEAMGDPKAEPPSAQLKAARQRSRLEREEHLEQALKELEKIREVKLGEEAKAQARVSLTDPQARIMKQSNGGFAPSYNVQLSTDATHGLIVGVGVGQSGNDAGELAEAVNRVEQNMGGKPKQLVADGGYTNRSNVLAMAQQGIDFIGSIPKADPSGAMKQHGIQEPFYPEAFIYEAEKDQYRCPAGEILRHKSTKNRKGDLEHSYQAAACATCPLKPQCCPGAKQGRSISRLEEAEIWKNFRAKMQTDEAKAIYRQRGAVAEFPNAWIKEKLGLRQFHVRGLVKAGMESIWACLTYNIQQWIRLRWRTQACPLAA